MTHRVKSIFGDGIAFEELRGIDLKAVTSKVVGKELSELRQCDDRARGGTMRTCTVINKVDAEDISYEEDGLIFRVIGLRSGNVCLDAVDLFIRPLGSRAAGDVGVSKCEIDKIRIDGSTFGRALMTSACEESYR